MTQRQIRLGIPGRLYVEEQAGAYDID